MDAVTLILWMIALPLTILSIIKRKEKTKLSAKSTQAMMKGMMPDIVAIIFLIGLVLSIFPPDRIAQLLGDLSPSSGTIIAALVGCITLIPAFVAFPLVGSLIDGGAHLVPSVAFLTTLTMVGIKTFPLEVKEFGVKFTVIRSLLSFALAILVAFMMGGLL